MADIKLTLLENAHSFLNHSLAQAVVAEENPDNWKYAILHLVQAIELFLKELLRKEHPVLIYRNIDKPRETVSLEYATIRLQRISNVKFKKERKIRVRPLLYTKNNSQTSSIALLTIEN